MSSKIKPGVAAYPITPNNATVFVPPYRSLLIAVAGNIAVDTPGGPANQVLTVPAGYLMCEVSRVYATGTTATGITGFL